MPIASESNHVADSMLCRIRLGWVMPAKYPKATATIALSANFSSICHQENLAIRAPHVVVGFAIFAQSGSFFFACRAKPNDAPSRALPNKAARRRAP
jgi:hypothetical protein